MQNTERLTHNLGELKEKYANARTQFMNGAISSLTYKNLTKHRAEMLSYNIIATAQSTEGLQAVIGIMDQFSVHDRDLLHEALQLKQIISSQNFVKFF